MKIDYINDIDYIDLLKLYIKYHNSIGSINTDFEYSVKLNKILEYSGVYTGIYIDNKIVGFMLITVSGTLGIIEAVYILPRYRVHAKKLYIFTEYICKDIGIILLSSNYATNEGKQIGIKLGFSTTGYKEI